MALFLNTNARPHKPRSSKLKSLHLLCHQTGKHPLPVKMKCIGASTSRQGEPMAAYACPFSGCKWREGWVESRGGKPKRLWGGRRRRPRGKS